MPAKTIGPNVHALLSYIRACRPNRWKVGIRRYWEDNDDRGLPHLTEAQLCVIKSLRNTHGPSWLANLNLDRASQNSR